MWNSRRLWNCLPQFFYIKTSETIFSKQTYQELFRQYYNPLCNYAYNYVKDNELAQDAVQEAFLNLWRNRKKLDAGPGIKSYLFTSTRNKVLEFIRRNKMMEDHSEKVRINELMRYDIEDDAEKYVRIEKIHSAIDTLPPKCREIFKMSKINGLSYREIANHLNISQKTVENQVIRGLKLLRDKLN